MSDKYRAIVSRSALDTELSAKRLELLHETLPDIRRIAAGLNRRRLGGAAT
jgi:hypothetical protein